MNFAKGYCNCFRRRTLYSPSETCAGTESETDKTSNWQKTVLYFCRIPDWKIAFQHLINLGLYDEVRETLASIGKSLADIEEQEPEPSLGNGGLGRLAACFLDSLATLDLPGDGVGLRYHCGLSSEFKNNIQNEAPDFWLTDQCAAKATDTVFPVSACRKHLFCKTLQTSCYRL